MSAIKLSVLALTFSLASVSSVADVCSSKASVERPQIPLAESADLDVMVSARQEVVNYVEARTIAINCMRDGTLRNARISSLHRFAGRFNEQLADFKEMNGVQH